MAVTVAISPGILVLVLGLQNIVAQQCSSNVGPKNIAGASQQSLQKVPCNLNQITQNSGFNFDSPPQPNIQQMNFQQQSNIQQAPFTQQPSNMQPQLNLQQVNSQQPVTSITNSQSLQQQQNQNLASNIFSALYGIKSQNHGPNNAKANPSQQNNYEPLPQTYVQSNPTFTVPTPIMNTPQTAIPPSSSSSFVEYPQFQPSFTVQTAPNSNVPSQQNQQIFAVPVQKTYTNGQNNGYVSSGASPYAASMQGPMVMVQGTQTNMPQSLPIVFSLQSSPTVSTQSQSALPLSQIIESQPIVYTVQTQPSLYSNQNQQVSNQPQGSYSAPTDSQSLISYIMSQMQNSQGNNNALGSILPAMLSKKSEKSSSMKALLPLIFNMLNERRNGCGCPHCGYKDNYHNHDIQEPLINTGYSNQKNYSVNEPIEDASSKISENGVDSTAKSPSKAYVIKDANNNNETINNTAETSEEVEEADDSEEDYEDE